MVRAQAGHLGAIQARHHLWRQGQAQRCQVQRRDAGTQPSGLGQLVVVGVGSGQLEAAGGDHLVGAFSGAGKLGLARLQVHRVAAQGADAGRAGEGGAGAAVIGLVAGAQTRHRQGQGGDVGRGGGLAGDRVVAHVRATIGVGQQNGFVGRGVFVVGGVGRIAEVAGGRHGDGVARHQAIGQQHSVGDTGGADAGGGQTIVDLVGGGDAGDGQWFGRDGAGAVARIGQAVVLAAIAVADGGGAEGHDFAAVSRTFVVKGHGGRTHGVAHHAQLAAQRAQVAGAGCVIGIAVIFFADDWGGQGHRLGGDGHCRIGGAQSVVVAAQAPIAGGAQSQTTDTGQ